MIDEHIFIIWKKRRLIHDAFPIIDILELQTNNSGVTSL
jgi:hypothetical protein